MDCIYSASDLPLPDIHPFIHRHQPCKVTTNTSGAVRVRWCLAQGHLHTQRSGTPPHELGTFQLPDLLLCPELRCPAPDILLSDSVPPNCRRRFDEVVTAHTGVIQLCSSQLQTKVCEPFFAVIFLHFLTLMDTTWIPSQSSLRFLDLSKRKQRKPWAF